MFSQGDPFFCTVNQLNCRMFLNIVTEIVIHLRSFISIMSTFFSFGIFISFCFEVVYPRGDAVCMAISYSENCLHQVNIRILCTHSSPQTANDEYELKLGYESNRDIRSAFYGYSCMSVFKFKDSLVLSTTGQACGKGLTQRKPRL